MEMLANTGYHGLEKYTLSLKVIILLKHFRKENCLRKRATLLFAPCHQVSSVRLKYLLVRYICQR